MRRLKVLKIFREGLPCNPSRILDFVLLTYSGFGVYHLLVGGIISNDGVKYIQIARVILGSSCEELREAGYFNVYSSLIAFAFVFTGSWELSGKLVSLVFGLLTIVSFYLLLCELLEKKVGVIISFLFAMCPMFIKLSNDVLRETVFFFLFFSTLLCISKCIKERKPYLLFFASVLTHLSVLTRLEGLLLLILVPLFFLLRRFERKCSLKVLGLYLVFLSLVPLTLILFPEEVQSVIKTNQVKLRVERVLGEKEVHSDRDVNIRPQASKWDAIVKFIRSFLHVILQAGKALGPIYLLLIALGIIEKGLRLDKFFLYWFVIALLASATFYCVSGCYHSRHGFFVGIPMLFWAYWGLKKLEGRISISFLLVLILILTLGQNLKPLRTEKIELKTAGDLIKSAGIAHEKIIATSRLGRAVFYSGNWSFSLEGVQAKSIEELREEMKKRRIRYLFLERHDLEKIGDERLLERAGFEKVEVQGFERLKEYKLILYKIRDS